MKRKFKIGNIFVSKPNEEFWLGLILENKEMYKVYLIKKPKDWKYTIDYYDIKNFENDCYKI
jgi:hypothetical protein